MENTFTIYLGDTGEERRRRRRRGLAAVLIASLVVAVLAKKPPEREPVPANIPAPATVIVVSEGAIGPPQPALPPLPSDSVVVTPPERRVKDRVRRPPRKDTRDGRPDTRSRERCCSRL